MIFYSMMMAAATAWACVSGTQIAVHPGKGAPGVEEIKIVTTDLLDSKKPATALKIDDDDGGMNLMSIVFAASALEESDLAQFKDAVLASLAKQRKYWEDWIKQYEKNPKAATRILVIQKALEANAKIAKEIEKDGLKKKHLMPLTQDVLRPIAQYTAYSFSVFENGRWKPQEARPPAELAPAIFNKIAEIDEDGETLQYRGSECGVVPVIGGAQGGKRTGQSGRGGAAGPR